MRRMSVSQLMQLNLLVCAQSKGEAGQAVGKVEAEADAAVAHAIPRALSMSRKAKKRYKRNVGLGQARNASGGGQWLHY